MYLRVVVKWMDGPLPWFTLVLYCNGLKHKVSHQKLLGLFNVNSLDSIKAVRVANARYYF